MQNGKNWLISLLIASLLFGSFNGITAFATEHIPTAEISVSENNAVSDEWQADSRTTSEEETSEEEILKANAGLSALHIGQLSKEENLPSPSDSEFEYDLPISLKESKPLLLFVNYSLDTTVDKTENGVLTWSILRAKKGTTAGSTTLLAAKDDWIGFETVSSAPFFSMTVDKDKSGGFYQTAMLVLNEKIPEIPDDYDYYIRAAYYCNIEDDTDIADGNADFYAAATIPFLSENSADTEPSQETVLNPEEIQLDTTVTESILPDSISENTVSENTVRVEDTVQDDISDVETLTDPSVAIEPTDAALSVEEIVSETSDSISLNSTSSNGAENILLLSETDDTPPLIRESFGVLTLNAENVTLHPGDKLSVKATLLSKTSDGVIVWKSMDRNVADVNDGVITAAAAGATQIVAKCGDAEAAVTVNVVAKDDREVYDLSGDIWVAGFQKEREDLIYTGQQVTQSIRVYHKETLLKEKTDYTLSYRNNINAAAWDSAKAPSLTITLRGQYQGSVTLYYTIRPATIENGNVSVTTSNQVVNYGKTLSIPNPELILGKRKLTLGRDFVCDYTTLPANYKKGDSYERGESYFYTVNGIGNFTGSIPMQLVVVDKTLNFNSAAVTLDQKQYTYRGTALSESEVRITKLTLNRTILSEELYEYTVYAEGIDGAYLMVYPTDAGKEAGYRGFKKVVLKLTGDRAIKDAVLGENWQESLSFSQKTVNEEGGIFQEKTGVLVYGAEGEDVLTEGQDYTVKYSNAKKVGTVTVTFTGKGRYKGTLSKRYKILPNMEKGNFTIRWKNVSRGEDAELLIAYQKGGAVPSFDLVDQNNNVLKTNTDYTIALKNNKKPGIMSCVITGKGNYKGYTESSQITITNGDISMGTLTVSDRSYSKTKNAWKAAVTVKDTNGKNLAAGTDYEKLPIYEYETMENEPIPAAGTTVTVTVVGKGCYEGSSLTGSYRIYQNSINQLLVTIDPQIYTGKEITLSPKDIHVYASAADKKKNIELQQESCYEIIGYRNNNKAGTANVTLRGTGDYGGTRAFSFKIQKKAYQINRVKTITLNSKSLTASMAELQDETTQTGTLTATITSEKAEPIANPTVIWSSSNTNIAVVETIKNDVSDSDTTATVATAASSVRIRVKKEGTITITATAQDNNKKATCKVTITNKPIFTENGKTIQEKIGSTRQLNLQYVQTDASGTAVAKWASSNPNVVSVDEKGLLSLKKAGLAVITVSVSKFKFTGQCYVISTGNETASEGRTLTYKRPSGVTDDTPHINGILRDWEWNRPGQYDCLYIPEGDYWIDAASGGIILTDNQTLLLHSQAKLHAIGNSSSNSSVIWAFGRDNITISGGQIIGERNAHSGNSGEWGHGINISGCTNALISNVEISQCWGDGIYLGLYDGWDKNGNRTKIYSNGIAIANCNLHHNRRNNLSITDASNVMIANCQFNYASGKAPQYGIDIEPNKGTCSNVTISDSTFHGNAKGTIQILGQLNAHIKGVTIENCKGDKAPVKWSGFGGSVSGVTEKNNNWTWNP